MNYPLPDDIQHRIEAQLASGSYSCEEDVLREAIDALERRQRGLMQLREMVAVAEEDVAAGRVGSFDRERIKQEVRNRLADQGISD